MSQLHGHQAAAGRLGPEGDLFTVSPSFSNVYSATFGIISQRPCPRARLRRYATLRARGQIFKLSLQPFTAR